MKKIIKSAWAVLLAFAATVAVQAAGPMKITSPNNKISVDLKTGKGEFGWTVSKDGKAVYSMEDVWISINGKTLGGDAAVKNVKTKAVNETFKPVVPLKFSNIENNRFRLYKSSSKTGNTYRTVSVKGFNRNKSCANATCS